MNELSRHIEILLLDNDCVIVPGFGGFMAHHRPAEYVEDAGLFYPPQRTLGFNSQLRLNDSLLAQSYVEAYDTSYPEAVQRIESEVNEIKQTIAIKGAYDFHGIGTVKRDTADVYNFEPCTAGLLTPELYALNAFSLDMLCEAPVITDIPVCGYVDTEEEEHKETIEKNHEDVSDIAEEDDDGNTIRIKLHTVRYILAAAMILLLFLFSSIPAGLGSNKIITCSVLDTEFLTSFIKDNAFLNNMRLQGPSKDKPATTDIATKAVTNTKESICAVKDEGKFVIVLASKVTKKGAEDFIARLDHAGYGEARIHEKGSMRKVVYGSYTTESAADAALQKFRKGNNTFEEGWISQI